MGHLDVRRIETPLSAVVSAVEHRRAVAAYRAACALGEQDREDGRGRGDVGDPEPSRGLALAGYSRLPIRFQAALRIAPTPISGRRWRCKPGRHATTERLRGRRSAGQHCGEFGTVGDADLAHCAG